MFVFVYIYPPIIVGCLLGGSMAPVTVKMGGA